jgi:hypothetical protein
LDEVVFRVQISIIIDVVLGEYWRRGCRCWSRIS